MNPLFRRALSFWFWAYLSTATLGAIIVWVVGHRGIYLFDQSGVFDGAWRMVQGQVLYRDFYAPYGPIVFWIQSLFFRLAGVDFSSMVLSAAVINSVAIVCVIWLIRRLFPNPLHRPTAIAAGLLTAVWFQAPFGTLWFEQTSFCFNLVAMVLLVETGFWSERTAVYLRVAAGCSLAISVLSKQSAGVVLLPVPLGVVVITCLTGRRQILGPLLQGIRRHPGRGCRICAVVVECFVSDGFLAIRCCDVPCAGRSPHRSRD
jgi:4-amino-4-deoxy-L-arabinose transferase-like glycosyltransferase